MELKTTRKLTERISAEIEGEDVYLRIDGNTVAMIGTVKNDSLEPRIYVFDGMKPDKVTGLSWIVGKFIMPIEEKITT